MNEFAPSNKLVVTAIGILLSGLLLTIVGFSYDIEALGVLGAGTTGASVVLIVRLIIAKFNPKVAKDIVISQKDERQHKIYIHAGNISFWIGMFALLILGMISRTKDPVLLFSPAVLLFIYLGSAFYYNKKF